MKSLIVKIILPLNTKTKEEALEELKKAKEKFDLKLITRVEYEKIESDLSEHLKIVN